MPADEEDRIAVVKVRFIIPREPPLAPFLRKYPEAILSVVSVQDLPGNRIMGLLDVLGPMPPDWLAVARRLTGVVSISPLGIRGPRTRILVIIRRPAFLALVNRFEALLRYPILIMGVVAVAEVVARVSQLRELVTHLRGFSRSVEIIRFGRDPMRTFPPTLTTRQHSLLHQALASGYFDVPRRVTLTELAKTLHRTKSSLSQTLARVERELAESSMISSF